MNDNIVAYVYWYPPSQMIPDSVSSIVSDNTGNLQVNFITGNYFFGGLTQNNILITPQAYVNWYSAQKQYMNNTQLTYFTSIYNAQINSINGYSSNILYEAAVLKTEGYYWLPYTQAIYSNNLTNNATNDPTDSGLTGNELYCLIKSMNSGTPNTTTLSNQSNNPNTYLNSGATSYSYNVNAYTSAQNTNVANTDTTTISNNATSQTLSNNQLYSNTNMGLTSSAINNAISNIKLPSIPQFMATLDILTIAEIGGIILLGYAMIKYGL